jgi:hypothetical protein
MNAVLSGGQTGNIPSWAGWSFIKKGDYMIFSIFIVATV